MALNKVLLIGNVGKDPEIRHLESGVSVATITLATSERYKDRNGEVKEITEWHTINAWRQLADLANNYIRKGSQIYVEGRIRTRNWDDQNGVKHYVTEILADNIQLLGRRDNGASPAGQGYQSTSSQGQYQAAGQDYQRTPAQYQNTPAAQQSPAPAQSSDLTDDGTDDLPF